MECLQNKIIHWNNQTEIKMLLTNQRFFPNRATKITLYTLFCILFFVSTKGFAQVNTFNYTGGDQTFTISDPAITAINIVTIGADGGNSSEVPGGSGATVYATFDVQLNDELTIVVGGKGANPGGGAGGSAVILDRGGVRTLLTVAGGGGGGSVVGTLGGGGRALQTAPGGGGFFGFSNGSAGGGFNGAGADGGGGSTGGGAGTLAGGGAGGGGGFIGGNGGYGFGGGGGGNSSTTPGGGGGHKGGHAYGGGIASVGGSSFTETTGLNGITGTKATRLDGVAGGGTSSHGTVIICTGDDGLAPVPDLASLPDYVGSCTTIAPPTALDNCEGPVTATTNDPTTFTLNGNYSITWTYTDCYGNSTTQVQNITINDTQAPTALCQNVTVQLDAAGNGSTTATDIDNGSNDACELASISLSQTSFDCAEVGTNTETLTVTDNNGNSSTCNTTITVQDNMVPTALCQNATVQVDQQLNATDIDAGSVDNCAVTQLSVAPNTFGCENIGSNTVTLTVSDAAGNTSTCIATVTVEDNSPPTAVCANPTVNLASNGTTTVAASFFDDGSSAACGEVDLSASMTDFDCNDEGNTYNVTLTVTSQSNGQTASCTAMVTVADPNSFCCAPPTAVCDDITVQLDAAGNVSISPADIGSSSTNDCDFASETLDNMDFDCTDIGANTVTYTIFDVENNSDNCTATVTVEDTTVPTAACQDITVSLDASGNASIAGADVDGGSTDNCAIASLSASPNTFDCADAGGNTVTLTATDASGNSDNCNATVTVEDNAAPTVLCEDITVQLDGAGSASITAADVDGGSSDNCAIANLSAAPNTFNCADAGANTLTLTATDASGNSDNCTATVTVEDNAAPPALCQDITVQLDGAGSASVTAADVDGGSTDNCSIANFSVVPNSFSCADAGANTVTLTATDASGNSDNCTATVTVEDNAAPTALCQDITVQLDGAGSASITTADVDGGSSDN